MTGNASHLDPSGFAVCQPPSANNAAQVLFLGKTEMRALILAFAGGLAVAPSALAAPLVPDRGSNELGSRPIELVDHACGWRWRPARWQDHWGHWHRHCFPHVHAHRGTRLEHPYADWRAPTGGWGNPQRRLREPWPMIPSNAVKTATDRAAEAIEAAAEKCRLGPELGCETGPDRDDHRCDPGRRRRREAEARMG